MFIPRDQCCADRGEKKRVFGQAQEKSRLESGAPLDVGHICVLALQAWEFENQRRNVIDLFVGGPPRLTSKHPRLPLSSSYYHVQKVQRTSTTVVAPQTFDFGVDLSPRHIKATTEPASSIH